MHPRPTTPTMRPMARLARCVSVACALLACIGCSYMFVIGEDANGQAGGGSSAPPQTGPLGPKDKEGFRFLWSVTTWVNYQQKTGRDLSQEFDLEGTPFDRHMIMLYEYQCGYFPIAGPHEYLADPAWMPRHLARVKHDMDKWVPDPSYDGLIVIDYERWAPLWDLAYDVPSTEGPLAHDADYKTDWREYIQQTQPQLLAGKTPQQQEDILRELYEDAAKDFYLTTLAKCRELRPNAKWGFWNYPMKVYRWPKLQNGYVFGYDDLKHPLSKVSDRLKWLYDAVDFLNPCIYATYQTVPDNVKPKEHQNWAKHELAYLRTMIHESLRVAQGKPVYACIWYRYHVDEQNNPLGTSFLTAQQMEWQLRVPFEEGAAGVMLWGALYTPEEKDKVQAYFNSTITPVVNGIVDDINAKKSGSGSGGVGGGSGSGSGSGSSSSGGSGSGSNSGSGVSTTTGSGGGGSGPGSGPGSGGGGGSSSGSAGNEPPAVASGGNENTPSAGGGGGGGSSFAAGGSSSGGGSSGGGSSGGGSSTSSWSGGGGGGAGMLGVMSFRTAGPGVFIPVRDQAFVVRMPGDRGGIARFTRPLPDQVRMALERRNAPAAGAEHQPAAQLAPEQAVTEAPEPAQQP